MQMIVGPFLNDTTLSFFSLATAIISNNFTDAEVKTFCTEGEVEGQLTLDKSVKLFLQSSNLSPDLSSDYLLRTINDQILIMNVNNAIRFLSKISFQNGKVYLDGLEMKKLMLVVSTRGAHPDALKHFKEQANLHFPEHLKEFIVLLDDLELESWKHMAIQVQQKHPDNPGIISQINGDFVYAYTDKQTVFNDELFDKINSKFKDKSYNTLVLVAPPERQQEISEWMSSKSEEQTNFEDMTLAIAKISFLEHMSVIRSKRCKDLYIDI